MRAEGDAPLPEGFIAKVALADDENTIEMFVNVTQVLQADRVRIVAAPFGLNGAAKQQYTEMVRRHQAA